MRGLQVFPPSASPRIVEGDLPIPQPGANEILVRVHAAGIMPTELSWYPTWHTRDGLERTGAVPSHEFAGEIAALGSAVEGWTVGASIFGMNDWFDDGAMADHCIARPEWIAPQPRNLAAADAASVPISALTAWQALFDRGKLTAGERVLIHGGAGSVGSMAIQLAHQSGAHVITTASPQNAAFVQQLGAAQSIDYQASDFTNDVQNIDLVLDTVGGATLEKSWAVLRTRGRLVTVASSSEAATDERNKQAFLLVAIRGDQLRHISAMLEAGKLRPVVDRVISFSDAPAAYRGELQRFGPGKTVAMIQRT